MSDSDQIATLLQIANDQAKFTQIQHKASQVKTDYQWPHYYCAITLSFLLQAAGIDVALTEGALELDNVLKARGWEVIQVGDEEPGDLGTTCGDVPRHGVDHIYLFLNMQDENAQIARVADNQAPAPHDRAILGDPAHNIDKTTYFLRAP